MLRNRQSTIDNRQSIGIIDNFDSFTYNLVQRIGELESSRPIQVWRNDAVTVTDLRRFGVTHLIISPGPGRPEDAGISMAAIRELAGEIPILGVCLGQQCIAQVFGGRVVTAARLVHGKTSMIHHDGNGLYRGISNPFEAARYHSLIVESDSLPAEFEACAWTDQGELMGIRHSRMSLEGVQFHPESFMTPEGQRLLANFLTLCGTGF